MVQAGTKENRKGGGGLRLLRVGENIRHALSSVLARGDFQHDVLNNVSVTISEVRCGRDLRSATIFIMPLGGEDQDAVTKALNEVAPFLRGQLSNKVKMKFLPELKFKIDDSFDEATHIDHLLRDPRVMKDVAAKGEE